MKKILMVLFASLAAIILADVSVEDVKCVQRYPWNGLVDIEYTIACDDPDAEIYVNPVGFNGDTGLTVFPTHFTGDGATNTVKAGKHTMVWDAKADMGLFASKNFQIKMYAGKTLAPYIVVDLSSGPDGDSFPIRYSIAGPDLSDDACRTTELWLRLIPPGTFMMGSPSDELGRSDNEDLHKVTITEPFYIGVFEVTNEQWYRVYGNHSYYGDSKYGSYPVTHKNWQTDLRGDVSNGGNYNSFVLEYYPTSTIVDKDKFFGKLRIKTDMNGFDLPTEAQWEFACRLGSDSALGNGKNLSGTTGCNNLNEVGRYYVNGTRGETNWSHTDASRATAIVGSYISNGYGLYDMHGNVGELCRDCYSDHLGYEDAIDPCYNGVVGSNKGISSFGAVVKGGNWKSYASACRSASREKESGDSERFGFRVSCPGNLQK